MICQQCGYENTHEATFCRECGSALTQPEQAQADEKKGPAHTWALVALILGVTAACLTVISLAGGVAAGPAVVAAIGGLIVSAMAMKKTKGHAADNKKANTGMILSAISTAVIAMAFMIVLVVMAVMLITMPVPFIAMLFGFGM